MPIAVSRHPGPAARDFSRVRTTPRGGVAVLAIVMNIRYRSVRSDGS